MGIRPKWAPFLAVCGGGVASAAVLVGGALSPMPQSAGAQVPRSTPGAQALVPSIAGSYVPLTPSRITDTRANSNYPNAGHPLGPAVSLNVQVAGVGAVPSTGVSAVVLNVTVVNPSASGFLTVFPQGTTQPVVSNLNFTVGETLANVVTVAVGDQGGVAIYNQTGTSNVLVDIEGYYTTTPLSTGLYNPVSPLRVLGTAESGLPVGAGTSTPVKVTGVDGVPTDASAVVVNLTVAGSNTSGYVTVFPAPSSGPVTPPGASSLNFAPGQVVANRVILPVGSDGQIEVYNFTGSVKVDVDLNGYYTGSTGELGSAFTPLSPTRFVDTRVGVNGADVGPDAAESFGLLSDGIPVTATAMAGDVTVIPGSGAGYLTIYPTNDAIPPVVSDANFTSNTVAQNFVLADLDRGGIKIFNSSAAPINIIIDAFGYFAPPPPATTIVADPYNVSADGVSTSTLTVTVTTGSGVAFDDPVALTTSPGIAGSCGVVTATGNTNAFGQVTATYISSTTAGMCTVTATEANEGTSGTVVITQTNAVT